MLINYDYQTSVSLGFFFPTEHLYGLPGREFDFDLKTTEESGPYRLFNRDLDPHWPRNRTELYGSIPYVTGHSVDFDASVAWINSADTWVEYVSREVGGVQGSYIDFLSEGGMLEFLMFGSSVHPARVQKSLAQATGFLSLPPLQTLGF
jgi:alpha 1,3-glucosidase|mmetsp:Transcript_33105/g.43599  ORF Transcript_33105/g.43599 Transcript_33105/m.43599 type:complete len:149 (+) Transcript_33105:641-1087(+)